MSDLSAAIKQVCEEKGLTYEAVITTIESALSAAYRKDFGQKNQNIQVEFNDKDILKSKIYDVKTVVEDMPEEKLVDGENEDDITCEDIFEIIEMLTHLDSNSITKTELIYQLFFEKVPDGQVAKVSTTQNNSNEKQIPQKIVQYLINTKRSIQEIR